MEELRYWQGAGAGLWSYSVSHSRLVMKLQRDDEEVFLIMEDVRGIWGPVAWPKSGLRAYKNEEAREWVVQDAEVGFMVTCGLVQITADEPGW